MWGNNYVGEIQIVRNIFMPLDMSERLIHLKVDFTKLFSDVSYEYTQKYFSDEDTLFLSKLNDALYSYNGYFQLYGYDRYNTTTIHSDESNENVNLNQKHYEFHRVGEKEILTTISNSFIIKIANDDSFRNQFTVDYVRYLLSILPAKDVYSMPLFDNYLRVLHLSSVE